MNFNGHTNKVRSRQCHYVAPMTSDKCLYTFMQSVRKDYQQSEGTITFDRLAEDALNLAYYHDATDTRSKNLHRKYHCIATGLFQRALELVLFYFTKSAFTYVDFQELLKAYNKGIVCPPKEHESHDPSPTKAQEDSPTPPHTSLYPCLNDHQINLIAQIANEVCLFYEEVTFDDIKGILTGNPRRTLCTRNNRLLFIFFDYLRTCYAICEQWKKPLADQRCIYTMSRNNKVKVRRLMTAQDLYAASSGVAKYGSQNSSQKVTSKFAEYSVFEMSNTQEQPIATRKD